MRLSAVALIDGEHYPVVVVDALRQMGARFEFKAAVFLGGAEKIMACDLESGAKETYGLPVVFDSDMSRGLARAIETYGPQVVVDLSDEPVLGYLQRFRLISESLARNVGYLGSDFHFNPVTLDRLCASPSLSVIGTGKRVGKTAISGFVVRVLQEVVTGRGGSPAVVVVAMGRGGPAQPELVDGRGGRLTVADLLALSRQGRHAASDHFEDALLSRVATIGCRRCGGGMAGEPFVSNVAEGVRLANTLAPGLIVLEGSGAALPPVASDVRMLVAGAHQPVETVAGHLGAYRVLVSDAVVLTMAEEPLASPEKVRELTQAIQAIKPGIVSIPVVLRPRPLEDVAGRRVAFFSTAPASQEEALCRYIEERWGGRVQLFSSNLADRKALRADFERSAMAGVEAVLTEIKAAAIDVVAEEASARGLPVIPVDNLPVEVAPAREGLLRQVVEQLAKDANERFRGGK
jgi:cyclic 2,3-diphosphoglycerate synthetase